MGTFKRFITVLFTLALAISMMPIAVQAVSTINEPIVAQNEGFIKPAGTVGLLTDLTPKYGSNGKFIAPIEPPAAGSIAISSRAELMKIGKDSAYPLNGAYHLTADIDLAPALYGGAEWVPIGSRAVKAFRGTFDGQGHIIRNLTITGAHKYVGLFGYSSKATIKNVGMEDIFINVFFSSDSYVGGICGYSSNGIINNCYNTGTVSASNTFFEQHLYIGGICGKIYIRGGSGIITNCYNTGEVSATARTDSHYFYAGGICGESHAPITNCYNTAEVSVDAISSVGGVCGENHAPITNCYNTGAVSAASIYFSCAGGICGGSDSGSIANCYNTGSVSSSGFSHLHSSAGGICGTGADSSPITNCYNTGAVNSSSGSYSTGGICGESHATITNCYNTGVVSSSSGSSISHTGGICGSDSGSITNCYNTGTVSASAGEHAYEDLYAGGICGYRTSSITNCYNTGAVSVSSPCETYAGGICGSSDCYKSDPITNCYNTGAVSASSVSPYYSPSSQAGGICGSSNRAITNCYNTGVVSAAASGSSLSGGVCGSSESKINNCYNTGAVLAVSHNYSSYAGGICGSSARNISNCYNTGAVSASYAGGICGDSDLYQSSSSTVDNCYWNIDSMQKVNGTERPDKDKVGVGDGDYTGTTTPLTTAEIQDISFVTLLNTNKGDNLNWALDENETNQGFPILTGK